jgi:F-type H+-transporting ATPase subunit a
MGEDKLIAVFVVLGAGMLSFAKVPFGLPIQVPIMFLALLTSTIQALVFTLLSTIYIALMLPHEEHAH